MRPTVLICLLLFVAPVRAERVYLVTSGSDSDLLMISAAVAASDHSGILIRETPIQRDGIRRFLKDFRAEKVVRIEANADPRPMWNSLFPRIDRVIIASKKDRPLAIQAAILAGLERVPLWLADESSPESKKIGEKIIASVPEVTLLRNADHVAQRILDHFAKNGPIESVIVVNPSDERHATLAPWLAHHFQAPVLFAPDGDVNRLFRSLPKVLNGVESVIILGDAKSIATEQRPNPLEGKDLAIEMEPLTPIGNDPFSYSIGRLFDTDPAGVLLTIARQRLIAISQPPRALIASNPGSSLDLLEMCSRHSARELRDRGFDTTELFRDDLTAEILRDRMPHQDLLIWEGHHNTLIRDWEFSSWDEPMKPSLVVLQSCLTLADEKVRPLFRRGAVAVVSTSSRTYSASGGAFTLAYLDAMLYDGCTNGEALRQAKNFLIAYGKLKDQRFAMGSKLNGANRRCAWSFALWGDPTLKLPLPDVTDTAPSAVRWSMESDSVIKVTIPQTDGELVRVGKYRASIRPNMRLAGLLQSDNDDRKPVPMVFGEIALPNAPEHGEPTLKTKLPSRNWTTLWDARRKVIYILAIPRSDDESIRFRVSWN